MQSPLNQIDAQLEQQLIALCGVIARRLVGEELSLHPEKVAAAVHEAVAALAQPARDMRIHLNPQDVQLLRDTLNLDTEANWKLVPDSGLGHGDCRVIAEHARVDALLDTRMASVIRSLFGEHE